MRNASLLVFSIPLLWTGACVQTEPVVTYTPYPKMQLSQSQLDFGTLAWGETSERTVVLSNEGFDLIDGVYIGMLMGVGTKTEGITGIDIGKGMDGNFSVRYDTDDIVCPEGVVEDEATTSPDAKAQDSAAPVPESGGAIDTGGGSIDEGDAYARFTLGSDCSIPLTLTFAPADVGDVWSSLYVESVQADQSEEEIDAGDLPAYLRDPVHWQQEVFLHGEAEKGEGTIVVTPRAFDFGYVYPGAAGDPEVARISVANVGEGDLTLGSAALSATCDGAYALATSFSANTLLEAGESTLVEVSFTPTDTSPAYCEVIITSDDATNSTLEVTLKGNSGADPENVPPTVAIRSPSPGFEYNSPNALQLELNIFDKNQPATSLTCKVKSLLSGSTLADCTAPDESGHVVVSIPRESFDTGIDTLTVTVTDAESISATDAVSVLINTAYPDSDDDGDGYGVESTPPDCDDNSRDTYPSAAEVYDRMDNDCDGVVDEGTEGFDDDGDGITEADGDCNDYNDQVYPAGPERADSIDNDCDGRVDEGTSLYDDDGDGFAEVNNDCNDSDPDISPSATELCDGLDNDCDGLKDSADGCLSTDSKPIVVGFPDGSQNACLEGETIPFTVKVFDADGQSPTYQWGDDKTTGGFDNPTAQTVNWKCPALSDGSAGGVYVVYVLVTDPDGQQDWGDTKVSVYPADAGIYDDYEKTTVTEVKTCSTTPGWAGVVASLLAGAAALRRRRA